MYRFLASALGLLLSLPQLALAQINTCPLGELSCATNANVYIRSTLIPGAQIAFGGLLFGMILYYAFKLLIRSYDQNAVSEVSNAYMYAFFGTTFFFLASLVADSFTTLGGANAEPFNQGAVLIGTVLRSLVATALLFTIAYQGFKLILEPDDNSREKARKRLIEAAFGVALCVLAAPLIETASGGDIEIAKTEGVGIANFLITIFGALAVIAIVVGGILLVISYDDSIKDTARKIILSGIVTLILVIASYSLITWFI